MKTIQSQQTILRDQIKVFEKAIRHKKHVLAKEVEVLVVAFAEDTGRGIFVESTVYFEDDGILNVGTKAGDVTT